MQVQQLVGQVQFSGMTPMGTQLDQKASSLLLSDKPQAAYDTSAVQRVKTGPV